MVYFRFDYFYSWCRSKSQKQTTLP